MRFLPAALVVVALSPGVGQARDLQERMTTMSDSQAEALAREALASHDEKFQRKALTQLDAHHFKSSRSRERETVLFAQGYIQDHLGDTARAAVTFHKLESTWPDSAYLPEGQAAMAEAALEHGRTKEAESRLNKALSSEILAESVRRCQEMLLWCLAEEGRAAEGIPTVKALQPLGTAKPTERGLVGIMEALLAGNLQEEARGTLGDYHRLYPQGAYLARLDLAWGKYLGSGGDARASAKVFQKLIQSKPSSPEADEARLALATLLTDGSLPPKDAEGFPEPRALLARVKNAKGKEDTTRRALMVNLRIALREGHWPAALETVSQFRALHPPPGEAAPVTELRAQAIRGLAQEALDKHETTRLLAFLDPEATLALTPAQRLDIARALASKGLSEASLALVRTSPAKEQPALTRATLEGVVPGTDPQGTLALLPSRGEGAQESLLRAQAAVALRKWDDARAPLAKARPGPARMQALMTYLNRPPDPREKPGARDREIQAWLARAREKGEDREPLVILAADHKARAGLWRAALTLYPANPSPANRGWVALMRASCQARLGLHGPAKATLKDARNEAGFKAERASLEGRLGS